MDKTEKAIAIIAASFIFFIGIGLYNKNKTTEKQLAQKTIEAENWKTLYQLNDTEK